MNKFERKPKLARRFGNESWIDVPRGIPISGRSEPDCLSVQVAKSNKQSSRIVFGENVLRKLEKTFRTRYVRFQTHPTEPVLRVLECRPDDLGAYELRPRTRKSGNKFSDVLDRVTLPITAVGLLNLRPGTHLVPPNLYDFDTEDHVSFIEIDFEDFVR